MLEDIVKSNIYLASLVFSTCTNIFVFRLPGLLNLNFSFVYESVGVFGFSKGLRLLFFSGSFSCPGLVD